MPDVLRRRFYIPTPNPTASQYDERMRWRRIVLWLVSICLLSIAAASLAQAPPMTARPALRECAKCKGKSPEPARYCMHCGIRLPAKRPQTLTPRLPDKTFCMACGKFAFGSHMACQTCGSSKVKTISYVIVDPKSIAAAQPKPCPHCRAPNRRMSGFCVQCGKSLSSKPAAVQSKRKGPIAYCPNCGKKGPGPICPECGTRLPGR